MTGHRPDVAELERVVAAVRDPELPMLTLADLGVVRAVTPTGARSARVDLTPTWSGCPALEVMAREVVDAAVTVGWCVTTRIVLSPAWTTEWLSEAGIEALRENGIAPPGRRGGPIPIRLGRTELGARGTTNPVGGRSTSCPCCDSPDVELLSRNGSTACTAMWRCRSCGDPFAQIVAV